MITKTIIQSALLSGVILGLMPSPIIKAATCSCAGVPLSNSINLMGLEVGNYQIGYTYTYSDISDLVAGTDDINDETGRERETNSHLLQTTYGISDNWSVTAVISWIEHTRNIAISNTADEVSSGIGDSLLVFSYAPKKIDPFSRDEWAIGLGLRLPTGIDDNKKNQIIFAEDLQPGQGAWGSSLWFHYGHAFSQKADWVLFIDANISDTKENDREYSFKSESNLTAGMYYSSGSDWNTSFAFNYRKADPHTRFGGEIPNTGGSWIDFMPSVQYSISPTMNVGISARIPVARDLIGSLQFTTKQSFSLTFSYLLE